MINDPLKSPETKDSERLLQMIAQRLRSVVYELEDQDLQVRNPHGDDKTESLRDELETCRRAVEHLLTETKA